MKTRSIALSLKSFVLLLKAERPGLPKNNLQWRNGN